MGPLLSVDVVPIFLGEDGLEILLSPRVFEPFLGDLALPGVLIVEGETLEEACYRALESKANIKRENISTLELVGGADSPHRDERGPTISLFHLGILDVARSPQFIRGVSYPLTKIPARLPFDHNLIIEKSLAFLREALWIDRGRLARSILGEEFTSAQIKKVLMDLNSEFDPSNLTRLLKKTGELEKVDTFYQKTQGRPPTVWRFIN